MPNRIIKESICTSETLEQLEPEEEVFFYRLIVNCDDFGIMDARPAILRAKCYPLKLDKVKEKDIEKWLQSLIKAGLIILYEVDGKQYLKMASWEKHQQIRARRSKYPLPDSEEAQLLTIDSNGNQMQSDDINCNQTQSNVPVIQSNPIQIESESKSNPNIYIPQKNKYAEFVSMTEEEYQKLVAKYGEPMTNRMIEVLNNYKGSKGKKYKSDYLAILNWVVDRVKKEQQQQPNRAASIDYDKASKSKWGW